VPVNGSAATARATRKIVRIRASLASVERNSLSAITQRFAPGRRARPVGHANVRALRRPHALLERDEATVRSPASALPAPGPTGGGLGVGWAGINNRDQRCKRERDQEGADQRHADSPTLPTPAELNTRHRPYSSAMLHWCDHDWISRSLLAMPGFGT